MHNLDEMIDEHDLVPPVPLPYVRGPHLMDYETYLSARCMDYTPSGSSFHMHLDGIRWQDWN